MKRKDFLHKIGAITVAGAVAGGVPSAFGPLKLLRPNRLKKGDRIGLVSPAGILYQTELFDRMETELKSMGLIPVYGEHVRNRYGYLAGRDEERAADLNRFFADPDIHAIMAVRGGWGSNRILDMIDFDSIRKHPKIFCGFSDITSLHLAILKKSRIVTFHGPNGNSEWTPFTTRHFKKLLFDAELPVFQNPASEIEALYSIRKGVSHGPLAGGNLSVFSTLIGSDYMPDLSGAILFLEDIGEDIYRIDRMLTHLTLSGVLNRISGFVFGRCTDCRESAAGSLTLQEVLEHHIGRLNIPAFYGSMISHEPNQFTLPVGVQVSIDAEKGTLKLLEPAVV
ncbi:MAG: LD-carboxypeptidase [Balneolaceae bacterium]